MTDPRNVVRACIDAGVEACHPERVVDGALSRNGDDLVVAGERVDLGAFERVLVLGGGKGSGRLAAAIEPVVDADGVVVSDEPASTDHVDVLVGDHPLPTPRNVDATEQVLECARDAGVDTLVLAIITGGGSAMLTAPAPGVSLDDLAATTRALLDAGAPIEDLNAVRKHASAIKGGQLARAAHPATVVTLVVSDVVGNDPSVIGSGPTVPDPSTFADAVAVLDRFGVETLREELTDPDRPETPKPGDPVFEDTRYVVLADTKTALDAARDEAIAHGYDPLLLTARLQGEAREVARVPVAIARETRESGSPLEPPCVLLSGGETTVTVTGDGVGGPNQEFALAAAMELAGTDGVAVGAVDTDGRDGGSTVAGAIVDGTTVTDRAAARAALDRNDAGTYLDAVDALVRTGATGTNVNDVHVIAVTPSRD